MGGGNPLKSIEKETKRIGRDIDTNTVQAVKGWDSNDWMTAIGTTIALTNPIGWATVAGATLVSSGQQGRAQDKAQEKADKADAQAMADARALQDRLEQEDYLMRLQSGVDSKTSKGSKTKYGTGSNVSMTAQDLLIPIANDTTKKTQPIGLGF